MHKQSENNSSYVNLIKSYVRTYNFFQYHRTVMARKLIPKMITNILSND